MIKLFAFVLIQWHATTPGEPFGIADAIPQGKPMTYIECAALASAFDHDSKPDLPVPACVPADVDF